MNNKEFIKRLWKDLSGVCINRQLIILKEKRLYNCCIKDPKSNNFLSGMLYKSEYKCEISNCPIMKRVLK